MVSQKRSQPTLVLGWLLFAVLLAAACAWILSLPVFPTQDGPVHVYYARVTRDLLAGHSTYARDFRVARPLPPYSLHAYLLMGFLQWASSEMAEKLLACVSVIVGAIGLGYFARQIGPSAPLACALAVPFLLNRFLFLGFYGYEIGIGLALLSTGVWLKDRRKSSARLIAFFALAVLTMLAHPVPYLILIAFCWSGMAAGWLNQRHPTGGTEGDEVAAPSGKELLTAIAATALFLYVKHYSHSGPLWNNELLADLREKLFRIINVFRAFEELPLTVPIYNWVLGGALAVIAFAACWRARRESWDGKITRTQLAAGWAVLVLIALPFLPRTMNGSGFFAERFAIWPPLLFFAAASSWPLRRKAQWIASAAAAALLVFTLAVLDTYIRPVARQVDVSAIPAGSMRGLHVDMRYDARTPRGFTFGPYVCTAVRAVDRGGAILVNSPWMDLQIMMLEEIGPKIEFDPDNGPRVVSGTPVPLGAVVPHCGENDNNTVAAWIANKHRDRWRLTRSGCYDMLQPLP